MAGLIVKGLLGLIALVFVGLGILLVPAHMQVRSVTPALPGATDLRALYELENRPTGIGYIVNAAQPALNRRLSHTSIIIEWADGRRFMIDAGMDEQAAAEFADLIKSMGGGGEAEFFGTITSQLGETVNNVAGVGFTHLHIDHTQGVGAFCEARGSGATLYQTLSQNALQNFNTTEGAAILTNSCLESEVVDQATLMPLDAFPGLALVSLGGHTPGSTLFAAAVGDRLWLFAGDTTNSMAALRGDEGKGFLYSYLFVPENTSRTSELRAWLNSLHDEDDMDVVISHDLEALIASGMQTYDR